MTDAHVMTIPASKDEPIVVTCPYPDSPRPCGYLEACGCDVHLESDRLTLHTYLVQLGHEAVDQHDPDECLETHDWLEGTYVALENGLRLTIPEHAECPETKLSHFYSPETGEICTGTGECGWAGEFGAIGGWDVLDSSGLANLPSGEYRFTVAMWNIDEFDIQLAPPTVHDVGKPVLNVSTGRNGTLMGLGHFDGVPRCVVHLDGESSVLYIAEADFTKGWRMK